MSLLSLSFRLSLCCLLALPLSAAGEDLSLLRAGTIEFTLDPGAISFLPIDTPALKEILCTGFSINYLGPISPRGECDLTVQVPSGVNVLSADTPRHAGSGHWQVPIHFSALGPWQGSAPVDTACGLWDVSLVLDPDSDQPVSTLVLTASAETPAQGTFASVIDLAALYRFVHRTDDTLLEVPARLSLDLAGQWATLPPGTPGLADSASNIALFVRGVQGKRFPAPACGAWSATNCGVCATRPQS